CRTGVPIGDPLSRRLAGRAEHLLHGLLSQHFACRACRLCCGGVPGRACAPWVVGRMQAEGVPTMILPKVRDPRFVTIRRGGTLTDADHHLLALWAASCAEHVLVSLSRLSLRTLGRVRRSSMPVSGCVARSQ